MSEQEQAQAEDTDVRPVENADAIEAEQETAEEAEEVSAPSEVDDSEEQEPEKPKRRSRAEERINALTREKYEAQKQAEAYQQQLMELQRQAQQQQLQRGSDAPMPTLAEFNYDENAYQQALSQWSDNRLQSFQEQQAEMQRQQQAAYEQQREAAMLQQKMQEGMLKYPDFAQKVNDPSLPPLREINQAAFQAVIQSDNSVDLAYYLANNPQEVYALAYMNPVQAIRTVAQIENRLNQKPTTKTAPPKPPSRVSGNSEAVKDPSKMTTEEFMEWRSASIRAKQR